MSTPAGNESSRTMLEEAFRAMGANPAQAAIMAAQLLRRAVQLARERGITETEAMAELLKKVVAGRQGSYAGDGQSQQ